MITELLQSRIPLKVLMDGGTFEAICVYDRCGEDLGRKSNPLQADRHFSENTSERSQASPSGLLPSPVRGGIAFLLCRDFVPDEKFGSMYHR